MTTTRPDARYIRPGEALALASSHVHTGPKGFFWLFGGGARASERRDDVAIVWVTDALEHHDDSWGSDNYESIRQRVADAMSGVDAQRCHEAEHRYEEDYQPIEATPPSAVVLCIDSPGGVVSGLNETVRALQKMRRESGIPLVAYVNEMAASAAYALACACDEILCPPSAILGSIGVISTMVSQAEHDREMGLDIRLITSGARKADGHVHAPITDRAVAAETARVEKLAAAFFKIASKARCISVDKIRGFQAGIFLGREAQSRGLADAVMSFDDVILGLSKVQTAPSRDAGGNETDRRADKNYLDSAKKARSFANELTLTSVSVAEETRMPVQLTANIRLLEAQIAQERDAKKRAALAANLAAYKKVEKHIEHTKSEEDDDDGDEDDAEEEDEEEEEEAEEKKASSEESEEEEAESEKSEEKKAAFSLYRKLSASLGLTGKSLVGAVSALAEKAEKFDRLSADVARLKATQLSATKNALIDEAVAQRRITRHQARDLRDAKLGFVRGFLAMHKSALVNIDEEAAHTPNNAPDADVPAAAKKMVEQAIVAQGLDGEKADAFRKRAYADHREQMAKTNGAGVY